MENNEINWIYVKDKLPEIDKYVTCETLNKNYISGKVHLKDENLCVISEFILDQDQNYKYFSFEMFKRWIYIQ